MRAVPEDNEGANLRLHAITVRVTLESRAQLEALALNGARSVGISRNQAVPRRDLRLAVFVGRDISSSAAGAGSRTLAGASVRECPQRRQPLLGSSTLCRGCRCAA
jgi:hypothetical protein